MSILDIIKRKRTEWENLRDKCDKTKRLQRVDWSFYDLMVFACDEILAEAKPEQSPWVAVADKPKKTGKYIVLTWDNDILLRIFNAKTGRWRHSPYRITHWMPIPPLPEQEM